MQELRDLARTPLISGFITDPPTMLSTDFVQGVNLDIDPYWLRAYRTNFAGYVEQSRCAYSFRIRRILGSKPLDWTWRPSAWSMHCRTKGYPDNAHPARIIVLLRAPVKQGYFAEVPHELGPHPVLYEVREPCIAHALAPGDELGRWASSGPVIGTLGGFLRNSRTGDCYLVSCEHVCGPVGNHVFSPRPKGASASAVAKVEHTTLPGSSSKCNRVQQPIAVADLALAKLDASASMQTTFPKVGILQRITPIADMTSDDPVSFEGAKSGHVQAKLGALNIWRQVRIHGTDHCGGDMFTIEPRQRWYVKPKLSQGGDSGAWVLSQTGGITSWDGMLIGGDGAQSYCCFAELVFAECQSKVADLILP